MCMEVGDEFQHNNSKIMPARPKNLRNMGCEFLSSDNEVFIIDFFTM